MKYYLKYQKYKTKYLILKGASDTARKAEEEFISYANSLHGHKIIGSFRIMNDKEIEAFKNAWQTLHSRERLKERDSSSAFGQMGTLPEGFMAIAPQKEDHLGKKIVVSGRLAAPITNDLKTIITFIPHRGKSTFHSWKANKKKENTEKLRQHNEERKKEREIREKREESKKKKNKERKKSGKAKSSGKGNDSGSGKAKSSDKGQEKSHNLGQRTAWKQPKKKKKK